MASRGFRHNKETYPTHGYNDKGHTRGTVTVDQLEVVESGIQNH